MTTLVALAPLGLEKLVAREIRALGGGIGKTRVANGRVGFEGPEDAVYRANLHLRVAERILIPLASGPATTFSDLRKLAAEVPWSHYIGRGIDVRFSTSARACRLYHTGAIESAVRQALESGGVSFPKAEVPRHVTVDLRGTHDVWTASIDSTGPGLWRRGYRQRTGKAPLRENLAAAMLMLAGWDGSIPLLDPMCGAGTIVLEAARLATKRAPGLDRSFAFETFPTFDDERWAELIEAARAATDPEGGGVSIVGADRDAGAVRAARENAGRAEVPGRVRIERKTLSETPSAEGPGLVVFNPPYSKRTEASPEDPAKWAAALLARRPGWDLVALAPDRATSDALGAKPRGLGRFRNGGIPVQVVYRPAAS